MPSNKTRPPPSRPAVLLLTLIIGALALICGLPGAARAGDVQVVGVKIARESSGTFRFDVTLRHGDEGWEHYADRWEVLAPDGTVLGTRVLQHPHVREQPFTRFLRGVAIPEGLSEVVVRAHDKVHGNGRKPVRVAVPR